LFDFSPARTTVEMLEPQSCVTAIGGNVDGVRGHDGDVDVAALIVRECQEIRSGDTWRIKFVRAMLALVHFNHPEDARDWEEMHRHAQELVWALAELRMTINGFRSELQRRGITNSWLLPTAERIRRWL